MATDRSFAEVDTAQRIRDEMRNVASREIDRKIAGRQIGRMITVDLTKLTGTVWLVGDEAPVSVYLFAGLIPGRWATQSRNPTGDIGTGFTGFGSMVVVERFSNLLYVTEVLSAGQFGYSQELLNLAITRQKPWSVDSNIAGDKYESLLNVYVDSTGLGSSAPGDALEFGPFVGSDETIRSGRLEMTVRTNEGGYKSYDVAVYGPDISSAPGWMRLVPQQQAVGSAGAAPGFDFDLDVSIRKTGLSSPVGTDSADWQEELWFRIVSQTSNVSVITASVTIRTTIIDKASGYDGRLVQYFKIRADEIKGYVGFHNSNAGFESYDRWMIVDSFNREVSSGWGSTEDPSAPWTVFSGSASDFSVLDFSNVDLIRGTSGKVSFTVAARKAATVQSSVHAGVGSWANSRNRALFYIAGLPPSSQTFSYILFQHWQDSNNYYMAIAQVASTGVVTLQFTRRVAGVESLRSSAASALVLSADKFFWLEYEHSGYNNNLYYLRAWEDGKSTPDWELTGTQGGFFVPALTGVGGESSATFNFDLHIIKYFSEPVERPVPADQIGAWVTGAWRNGELRVASDLQRAFSPQGAKFDWFDGLGITWITPLYISGVGRHRDGLADGRAVLSAPIEGETIPVYPSDTDEYLTSVDGYIPLEPGMTLWCAVPPGHRNVDLNKYLFVVKDNASLVGSNFQLPEWAVMIASRSSNPDSTGVKTGDGFGAGTNSTKGESVLFVALNSNVSESAGVETTALESYAVTYGAGNFYKCEAKVSLTAQTAGNVALLSLYAMPTGTLIDQCEVTIPTASATPMNVILVGNAKAFTTAPGTFKLTIKRTGGTGYVRAVGSGGGLVGVNTKMWVSVI